MRADFCAWQATTAYSTPCSLAGSGRYNEDSRRTAAMLLAIDVGNTNTVLGLYQLANGTAAPELVANWRITTQSKQTSDEFAILLRNLFGLKGIETSVVSEIAIS